jgi:hypothetical protein
MLNTCLSPPASAPTSTTPGTTATSTSTTSGTTPTTAPTARASSAPTRALPAGGATVAEVFSAAPATIDALKGTATIPRTLRGESTTAAKRTLRWSVTAANGALTWAITS